MTEKISKVDPITFIKNYYDVSEIKRKIEKHKERLKQKAKSSEGLKNFIEFLSKHIFEDDYFYYFPSDDRFPYNLSDLGSHLLLSAGIIKLILQLLNSTKNSFGEVKRILGIDFDISLENLFLLGRFTGLMHDITKPIIRNHSEKSAEFAEKLLKILEIPKDWINFVVTGIKEHHQSNIDNLFSEIVQLSDWLATSNRIPFTNPYFMKAFLEKYDKTKVPFANKENLLNTLQDYIKKTAQEDKQALYDVDENLIKNFKTTKIKNRKGNQYPYFITSESPNFVIKKIQKISGKADFPLDKPCLTFVDLSFKSIQNFIFKGANLKRIIGGSLLVQLFEDIFSSAFSKISCPELIISKGGGNLLGLLPISVKKEDLEAEVQKEIFIKIEKYYKSDDNSHINNLVKKLLNYVRITHSKEYRVYLHELRYGRDLEQDPEKSYDYSYYYKKYQQGTKRDKELILKYFLHPNSINEIIQNYNLSSIVHLVSNNDWKLTESEFFLAFQERKTFGELISNFYDSVLKKNSLKKNTWDEKNEKGVCRECQETFKISNDLNDSDKCYVCELCLKLTNNNEYLKNFPTQRVHNDLITYLEEEEKIDIKRDRFLNLDEISTPSLHPNNSNYMGFIRLDGNNFGMIKSYMKTFAAYRAFSRFIKKRTEEMLLDACKETINSWIKGYKTKDFTNSLSTPLFRFFILGGDDISLALHSELTLPFIKNFFRKIKLNYGHKVDKKELEEKIGGDHITIYPTGFSGGALITNIKTPFNILNNCAHFLEQKAKEFIKPKYVETKSKRLYGGALNSIAPIYITQGLTKNYIQQYYEHKLNPYYTFCEFPLDGEGYNKFLDRIEEVLTNNISQRSFKSVFRNGLRLIPRELSLQLYYKAGREKKERKAEFWSKLARELSTEINNYENNERYQTKYNNKILIKRFESIELSRFMLNT